MIELENAVKVEIAGSRGLHLSLMYIVRSSRVFFPFI
jgi:hypothetical protein